MFEDSTYYIMDDTGGIQFVWSGQHFPIGTELEIVGTVGYNGNEIR